MVSGCWPAGHFLFHAEIDGKFETRPYTPISLLNMKGKVEFAIKTYRKNDAFPSGGKFSQNLEDNVKVGDSLLCSGPVGYLKYFGNGKFAFNGNELKPKTKLVLIPGGSGLTPMFSIAQAAIHSGDKMDITFLFSNKTKDDILCPDEINALNAKAPN